MNELAVLVLVLLFHHTVAVLISVTAKKTHKIRNIIPDAYNLIFYGTEVQGWLSWIAAKTTITLKFGSN